MNNKKYFGQKIAYYSLIGLVLTSLTSCIVYRDATTQEDDGIYASDQARTEVVVDNRQPYNKY